MYVVAAERDTFHSCWRLVTGDSLQSVNADFTKREMNREKNSITSGLRRNETKRLCKAKCQERDVSPLATWIFSTTGVVEPVNAIGDAGTLLQELHGGDENASIVVQARLREQWGEAKGLSQVIYVMCATIARLTPADI